MKVNYREAREKLVAWIREQVIGLGADDKKERWQAEFSIKGMRPSEVFQCGVLFPIAEQGVDPASEGDEPDAAIESVEDDDATQDDAAGNRVRYVPPSSCGFSFYVEGDEIQLDIRCWAVRYESSKRVTQQEVWERLRCAPKDGCIWNLPLPSEEARRRAVFNLQLFPDDADRRARLQAICRPHRDGWLVTLSLSNTQRLPAFEDGNFPEWVKKSEQLCLFECVLECRVTSGQVGNYPRAAMDLLSAEDQELAIQYRNKRVLAVGHGVGVDWNTDAQGETTVHTNFMPSVEVPSVTADTGDENDPTLDLDFLATIEQDPKPVIERLTDFVNDYEQWIVGQQAECATLHAVDDAHGQAAASRIIGRMEQCMHRMRKGIACLSGKHDDAVRRAFAVANRAMAQQMRQGRLVSGLPERTPRWRPFQLGFLLMVLESALALDDKHLDRDLVDLIWFPTGGARPKPI